MESDRGGSEKGITQYRRGRVRDGVTGTNLSIQDYCLPCAARLTELHNLEAELHAEEREGMPKKTAERLTFSALSECVPAGLELKFEKTELYLSLACLPLLFNVSPPFPVLDFF